MSTTVLTSWPITVTAATVVLASLIVCIVRRCTNHRRRPIAVTSSDRAEVSITTPRLDGGRDAAMTVDSRVSSAGVTTSDGDRPQPGTCSSDRPLAAKAGQFDDVGGSGRHSTAGRWRVGTGPADHQLGGATVADPLGDERDWTFDRLPDGVSEPDKCAPIDAGDLRHRLFADPSTVGTFDVAADGNSSSSTSAMTVAVATELRELRAQLERERDRRIVAEEWSAFLLVTLRSYLAAHDAYDRRPVAPRSVGSGCADIGSSSSADEESTKVVAGKTSAENERGVDGSSSSGRASAIPKLRRRFERGSASSGQEAAAKDSVQSETTSLREPDYQRWLANYRAKRAAGGGQSKGDSIRDIGKTETDDEVAEWERAVTYNEAILRQKPASASDTAGCRCRKSLRCYRMVNDDGRRGKQSSNGLANEPTKVGEQHPLDAVGEIKQRWVQRNEERPQEKSKDGGNILTSAGPDRQTGRNEQTQKPPPSEFQQLATLDSSEDRLTHREKQVTQQQATAKASESDDSERQRDALNRKPGSTTQDEYEGNDDSEIWTLSVRQRVNSWRRGKLSAALTETQQHQRRATACDSAATSAAGTSSCPDDSSLREFDQTAPANDGADRMTMASTEDTSVTPQVAALAHVSSGTSSTTIAAVSDVAASSAATSSSSAVDFYHDEVVFEPVAKVGDARALFERLHRQTTTNMASVVTADVPMAAAAADGVAG